MNTLAMPSSKNARQRFSRVDEIRLQGKIGAYSRAHQLSERERIANDIIRSFENIIQGKARGLVPNRIDQLDAEQVARLSLFELLEKGTEPGVFFGYAIHAIHYSVIDYLRVTSRVRSREDSFENMNYLPPRLISFETPETFCERKKINRHLNSAIKTLALNGLDQMILEKIVLPAFFDGDKHRDLSCVMKEIKEKFKITCDVTIRSRATRLRVRLREALKNQLAK